MIMRTQKVQIELEPISILRRPVLINRQLIKSLGILPALSMNRTPKRVPMVMIGLWRAFMRSCCLVETTPAFFAISGI